MHVNYEYELMHYGVKGMKWGVRRRSKEERYEARTKRKYAHSGRLSGQAAYERDQAAEIVRKHNRNADVFDKAAKNYERKGQVFKAEASRKAADAIRSRGANAKVEHEQMAAYYERRATRINEKASAYATKKRVDLGKAKIDAILKENKDIGYQNALDMAEFDRQASIQNKYGNAGLAVYNKVRGN